MFKITFLLFVTTLLTVAVLAQHPNPYKSIGKKAKILTAYNGRFDEFFDYDSIQRIGSVLFNIRSKKIVRLLNADSVFKKASDNSSASRWWSVDPLAGTKKNISNSPYVFVKNNPIILIDPDGKDWFYYQAQGDKQASWHWNKGRKATYTNTDGESVTTKNGFKNLVVYKETGENLFGARTGTITVYRQNKAVLTEKGVFTGSGFWATGSNPLKGGFSPVTDGNYMMNLGDRSVMKNNQNVGKNVTNPAPSFGMEQIPDGTNIVQTGGNLHSVNDDYGNGRIRLNPVNSNMAYDPGKDRGYYLHGKGAWYNRTHGCICDKNEGIFNYFWSGSGNDIRSPTPFAVNVPTQIHNEDDD